MSDLLRSFARRLFSSAPHEQPALAAQRGDFSDDLCERLGLSRAFGALLLANRPPAGFRYRHFTRPKKSGEPRALVEPGAQLKRVQQAINAQLLHDVQAHPAALGFRRGRSVADHAWAHAGAALIITADIADFFPSTARARIHDWWRAQGHSEGDARLLTHITTYRGHLPQGAPTSPPLSNLVNVEMDAAIDRYTRANGGVYSRYADDLAFSWREANAAPTGFEQGIRARLRAVGYTLHPHKGWLRWRRRDEPTITGVTLTRRGEVELPLAMREIMRQLARSSTPADRQRLIGYEAYRAMVRRGHS